MKNSRIEFKFCRSKEQVVDTFIKLSNWLCTTSPRRCLVWLTLKIRFRNTVKNINMTSIEIRRILEILEILGIIYFKKIDEKLHIVLWKPLFITLYFKKKNQ